MCLESQGNFSWPWLRKIANICLESGGGVKFDLKAPRGSLLNLALSGVKNDASYENFAKLAPWHQKRREVPFLRASTLLVPGYIGPEEIKEIAKFIASVDPSIPYSLLAFAPCYLFGDMPLLKRDVAHECKRVAERAGLERVRIGNLHLLR
jgi:pyruvate formate lyase activating enzyme